MRAFYTLHFGLTPARLHPLARLTRLAYIKKYKRGYSVHISKVEHTKLIIHYFYIINVCHYANLYLDTSVTEQPSSIGEKFPDGRLFPQCDDPTECVPKHTHSLTLGM